MCNIFKELFRKKKPNTKPLKDGDKIKITYLPPCRNASIGSKNPYIGMEGEVFDFNGETFSIYTGQAWLCAIKYSTCEFEHIL